MVEYFEVKKAKKAEPEEVASAWMENLRVLEKAHTRVFRKVVKEIIAYTGENELDQALIRVAEELLERHKRNKALQSVKIAITYNKYLRFYYGSLVKLYLDGSVTYSSRATIDGYGFVIYNGVEV